MRLFIAFEFDKETNKKLCDILSSYKELGVLGNYTDKDNLHLTLAFLGNVNTGVDIIKKIIDYVSLNTKEFELKGTGTKSFKIRDKRLLYYAFLENDECNKCVSDLRCLLKKNRIYFDEKEFKPHITLIREASDKVINKDIKLDINISSISLMESRRIEDKLKYIELYKKEFKR